MIWHWLRLHPRVVDTGVVLFMVMLTLAEAGHHSVPAGALLVGVAGGVALWWRRRYSTIVVAVTVTTAILAAQLGARVPPVTVAIALYTLAASRERRSSLAVGAGAVVVSGAGFVIATSAGISDSLIARVVFLVAAWLLGDSVRSHHAYTVEMEAKARRLEHERDSEARRAVAEEQARIAREVHDVVAHALSVVVIQAAAADDIFDTDPARARTPIRAVEQTARAALDDLRRILSTIDRPASYEPQPALGELSRLVDNVRATGLDVTLRVDGSPRPLPATIELSAYRIVQEALTNTLRHARAGRASVRVGYGESLQLEIDDDGVGTSATNGGGHGLIGMRERVAMLGGSLSTGPGERGGFHVEAQIPLEG
jgi:signal transduction histidine kinase